MKLKELTVSVSQKVGLENYSSKGYGLTATVELSETDNLLKVKQDLTDRLNQLLDFEIKRIRTNGGQK